MNTKFSTLMASLLLATAFSSSAWAVDNKLLSVKNGENVGITVTVGSDSKGLAIKNQKLSGAGSKASDKLKKMVESTNVENDFNNLNKVTWNVEVVENTTAAGVQKTYRISNKYSGEYIAYKLKTNGKTSGGTELDQAGNKTWALYSDGVLYAYVPNAEEGKDSTYYLNESFTLVAVQGLKTATGDFTSPLKFDAEDLSATPITLNAAIFNYIMGKNDGLLHFNGGKDVSSNETNILKDTKWTAVDYNSTDNSFALTNGETVTGPNNDMAVDSDKKVISIEKKKYLIVDTLYQDKAAKQYFKLAVDTIPYEAYTKDAANGLKKAGTFNESATNKGAVKRSTKQAAFKGTYTFTNDSIALNAVNVPVVNGKTSLFFNNQAVEATVSAVNSKVATDVENNKPSAGQVILRQLGNGVVLTVAGQATEAATGWIVPMIQPYAKAASAGDAVIDTKAVVYSLQIAGQYANSLRATLDKGAYLISKANDKYSLSNVIDGSNVYAQWAFIEGAAGKVITVANILGQTIANQVAASDNVTIAAPAGVVVVAVEGEVTKVVVK